MDKYLNEVICGDNVDVMRKFPDGSVDLTVTSPPYDNLRTYNGYDWDFEGLARELFRVTKDGGVVVWIVNDATINGSETGTSFRQALYFKGIGFNIHDTMIWNKGTAPFQHKTRYISATEYMFVLSKGRIKTSNIIKDRKNKHGGQVISGTNRMPDGRLVRLSGASKGRKVAEYGARLNVWEISPARNNLTGHPAVFPEELVRDHILSWSNEGDVVLDPFIGSGTTAKMAKLNKRYYIGIDISEEYCDLARERIDKSIIK